MTTLAPSFANAKAAARPIPELPPVTRATLLAQSLHTLTSFLPSRLWVLGVPENLPFRHGATRLRISRRPLRQTPEPKVGGALAL